jgi:3-isopropylmalate dehydratase small subunit
VETVYSGRVWKFGDKISTDLMVPGSYVLARRNIDPAEAALQCMRATGRTGPGRSGPARS